MSSETSEQGNGLEVAIVGMAIRFPGADHPDQFWQNLREGVESITFFTDEVLEASGIPAKVLADPAYVKARGTLKDIEWFDASFFGVTPREAELMDPQHRLFMESAWKALEHAGYDPASYEGSIGVYAGVGLNTYMTNIYSNRELLKSMTNLQAVIGNDKDHLTTRVSYKLNLKGPSITIQTACSTSLVAVHLASQGLLGGGCDMALAGGASVGVRQQGGYFYREGGIVSPDGHCRAFDARAQGCVGSSGVGVVVLKRLEDALADGDNIWAVIKGSAINNDGSAKVGYTAPSVDGQAGAIRAAQIMAEVEPESISYVEAHGTGTALGDPIEIAALKQVFRAATQKKGFCAVGSVKTNVGHLDTAAGVAGLIKTALALKHKKLPPSLHFEQPNPKIDFEDSPFYVNARLSEWEAGRTPRRAGVSSFGLGGTNAHVVLEEAPAPRATRACRPWHVLVLSAKTAPALEAMTSNLVDHLKLNPELNLADAAYTLQTGRGAFGHRRMLVCHDRDTALAALEARDPGRLFTSVCQRADPAVAFMFTGQGAQYVNMGFDLYQVEAAFREQVDRCAELLRPHLKLDLRHVLYPDRGTFGAEEAAALLGQTYLTQPALFVTEYALARLWMQWGVRPAAMIGHSLGEYVAACLAGVFSLEDALRLVAARGRMMQNLPGGAMLAVALPWQEAQALLGESLSLAANNGPSKSVISGPAEVVEELQQQLTQRGVSCRRLQTSHAFHSKMMEPILGPFTEQVKRVDLRPPRIPYVSNVTGTWVTAAEATDPYYWARHLRQTVLFAEGLGELLRGQNQILLEVGPGHGLGTLARQHRDKSAEQAVLSSLRPPNEQRSDVDFLLNTLGKLWLAGRQLDWSEFHARGRHQRVPLPTYPFERKRYWVELALPEAKKEPGEVGSQESTNGVTGASGTEPSTLNKEPATTSPAPWRGLAAGEGAPGVEEDDFQLRQIIEQQIQLMGQQLELLRLMEENGEMLPSALSSETAALLFEGRSAGAGGGLQGEV